MIDEAEFQDALACYKRDFVRKQWPREKWKWEAVKWFQDHWDMEAEDFAGMLDASLSKTSILLAASNNYPKQMIVDFAQAAPEEVRDMFRQLFYEKQDVIDRIVSFKEKSVTLLDRYGGGAKNHYQTENAISVYLWLRYPDKYYIYKYGEIKVAIQKLGGDAHFEKGNYEENLRNFHRIYDEICAKLSQDDEMKRLLQSQLTDTCYPDPALKTLTFDFGFYISRYYHAEEEQTPALPAPTPSITPASVTPAEKPNYWFLSANPRIWSMSLQAVGEVQAFTLLNDNGHKRRIYQNFLDAKAGDRVIGYESSPSKKIVALLEVSQAQDGEMIYFKKLEGLSAPIDFATFRDTKELQSMEYFNMTQGTLFKLSENEYDCLMDMIREENPAPRVNEPYAAYTKTDFLKDVYMSEDKYDRLVSVMKRKKNMILQGAPGVGKTFAAERLAYSMLGKKDTSHVSLIQFHQNYSYEDFIMGYRPTENGFALTPGVFYEFCQKAQQHPREDYFFLIDEINRGNMSKIFGELLMLIENSYRGKPVTLSSNGESFTVPKNLYVIGMMNTADRSLAMIDYALRRRFSFIELEPSFETEGFKAYQKGLGNEILDKLVAAVERLNEEIKNDSSLGKGFCIGHSYFCGLENPKDCTVSWMREVVEYDILPMLEEYWFDSPAQVAKWESELRGVLA